MTFNKPIKNWERNWVRDKWERVNGSPVQVCTGTGTVQYRVQYSTVQGTVQYRVQVRTGTVQGTGTVQYSTVVPPRRTVLFHGLYSARHSPPTFRLTAVAFSELAALTCFDDLAHSLSLTTVIFQPQT